MVDYLKALKRPFSDLDKFIVGIILNLPIPLVKLVSNTIVQGYVLRCGRTAYEKKYELPSWKDVIQLWIRGFLSGLIALIYSLPSLIILFFFLPTILNDVVSDPFNVLYNTINPFYFINTYGYAIVIAWLFSLITSYIIPVALMRWTVEDDIKNAFELRTIFENVLTKKYIVVRSITLLITYAAVILFLAINFAIFGDVKNTTTWNTVSLLLPAIGILVISSIKDYIISIFSYSLYGDVLGEIKKDGREHSRKPK
ncbi:MAG: DUF4013 domain-containing protein [Candidatus Aenigmarchaeota archaeon]|nr:DUF4013 domain-containing protein [Candidatus Aenigmarchaeota archaeon]